MTAARSPPGIWVGQRLHFVSASILLVCVWLLWTSIGRPFLIAFWTAIAVPIVHQVFVWLAWRVELLTSTTTNTIGFRGYVITFFLLFGGRFVSLTVLAWLDRGSLELHVVPQAVVTTLFALIGGYAMYSVRKYFGMTRAAGADHFDVRYRSMPLVKEGLFRFTSNGMYTCAFLLFWAIAFAFNSRAAVVVAAFSHAYIWVHYFATEKPDMDYLYSAGE